MKHLQIYEGFLLENINPLDALPKFLTREMTRGVKEMLERYPPEDMTRISEIANEINDIIADKQLGISWSRLLKSSAKLQGPWSHPVLYFERMLRNMQETRDRHKTHPQWDMRR